MKKKKRLHQVIFGKTKQAFEVRLDGIADGFEDGNSSKIVRNAVPLTLMGLTILFLFVLLIYLIVKYWIQLLLIACGITSIQEWAKGRKKDDDDGGENDKEKKRRLDMIYGIAREMQPIILEFMLRVIIAVSSNTAVIRPREVQEIIYCTQNDGASFYMIDDVVIYQVEVEVEGEITPEVEETIRQKTQEKAQKYILEYPTLVYQEASGGVPVEILAAKKHGDCVLIDFVFASAKTFAMIEARRMARIQRKELQERVRPYVDEDYGE